jgi:hypothetical protein
MIKQSDFAHYIRVLHTLIYLAALFRISIFTLLYYPTRGGPPAWALGVGLTTPHRKK